MKSLSNISGKEFVRIPKFLSLGRVDIKGLDHWLEWREGKLRILTNALRQPELYLWPNESPKGDWLFQRGEKLILISEGKESVVDEENDTKFVRVGEEIEKIRLLDRPEFKGERFDGLMENGKVTVLTGKKVVAFSEGRTWETDGGKVTIRGDYVSVTREGYTEVWRGGQVFNLDGEGYVLGRNEKGLVFREIEGIIREEGGRVLGVCTGETFLLGEGERTLIWCDGSVRLPLKGGWRELGRSPMPLSCSCGNNYAILAGEETTVIDLFELHSLVRLKQIHRSAVDDRRAFVTTKNGEVAILDLVEGEDEPIKILSQMGEGRGAKVRVRGGMGQVEIRGDLLEIGREEGRDIILEVEPLWLEGGKGEVVVSNPFWSFGEEIWLDGASPKLEIGDLRLLVAKEGKCVEGEGNALIEGKVTYSIPGGKGCTLVIDGDGGRKEITLKGEGETLFALVGRKFDLKQSDIRFTLLRMGKVIMREVRLLTPVIVDRPKVPSVRTKSRKGNMEEEREVWSDGRFVWTKVTRVPVDYIGVFFGKVGEYSELIGAEITEGPQLVEKDGREYLIVGLRDPVKGIKLESTGTSLIVHVDSEKPVEVVHGLNSARGWKKLEVPMDPIFPWVKVRAFDQGLIWERTIKLPNELTLLTAVRAGRALARELESYGLL
jgi:hypothetical protein